MTDALETENAKAQATKNGSVISTPEEEASMVPDQLIEPLDFSCLAREFDFPEDTAYSNPERSDMERMMAQLEFELNAPQQDI